MAFCGNCGAQVKGDERFCVACGADLSGKAAPAASVTAAPMAAAPVGALPMVAPPPMAVIPGANGSAATVPVMVVAPQAHGGGKMRWVIAAVVVVGALVYYAQHRPATAGAPSQPSGPAQPAAQRQDPAVLVQQQSFSGHWQAIYGFVELTNTSWTNHATVAIQSATLECDQYSSNGGKLSQLQTTLNGPVQPNATATFNPFQMGSVSTYMTRVTCNIVAVAPAS